jgi:hypothetical protein
MVGVDISLIPNGDSGIYTGVLEPSFLGGSFPMQRIGSLTLHNTAGVKNFPPDLHGGGATNYITGDHGSFADPLSSVGAAMQFTAVNWAASSGKNRFVHAASPYDLTDLVIDEIDLTIPVMQGETRLGRIIVTETGDATNPVEAEFETIGDAGTLGAAAAALGGHHFNWYQLVIADDDPPNATSGDPATFGAPLTVPRIDPPSGGTGNTVLNLPNGTYADDKPWLWNEVQVGPGEFSDDQANSGLPFYCVREFTNNPFAATPPGVDPCVGDPSQQSSLSYQIGPWAGNLTDIGNRFRVRAWLVLVDIDGNQVRLLNGFTFGQQVTSGAGGIGSATTTTGIAQMPGSPGTTGDDTILQGF